MIKDLVRLRPLIAASMPSGVEHERGLGTSPSPTYLIAASMPSGVEHRKHNPSNRGAARPDRRLDAFGR